MPFASDVVPTVSSGTQVTPIVIAIIVGLIVTVVGGWMVGMLSRSEARRQKEANDTADRLTKVEGSVQALREAVIACIPDARLWLAQRESRE